MAIPTATLISVFGLLGDIISLMVFLAPVPTFYQIYRKKSGEGFQALPYIVALFSCMLWIYYALVIAKTNNIYLISINSFGCLIESIYLIIFLIYAPNKTRLSTLKIILLLNVFGYGAMLLSTYYLMKGSTRDHVIKAISLVFNVGVFTAPLCILKKVIKTKSVEFMPINLSFFLTLNAVMWFFFGFLQNDYVIALPNILGFVFGIIQMVLYMMYRNNKQVILEEPLKLQELNNINHDNNNNGHIIDIVKLGTNHHESNDVVVNVTNNNQEQGSEDGHKKINMDNNNNNSDCKV